MLYILNKVPQKELGKLIPKEVFSGKKPKVSHFKIFGSIGYCHVLDEKHTKMDQTTEKGFFIGYTETSKAYRIYIPSSRKITMRRDVKFMEDRAFKRSCKLPTNDQKRPIEAPLVHQKGLPQGQQLGKSQGSNIGTSTNMTLGTRDFVSL